MSKRFLFHYSERPGLRGERVQASSAVGHA